MSEPAADEPVAVEPGRGVDHRAPAERDEPSENPSPPPVPAEPAPAPGPVQTEPAAPPPAGPADDDESEPEALFAIDLHDAPPPLVIQCPHCQATFAYGPEHIAPLQPNQHESFRACPACEGLCKVTTGSLDDLHAVVDCPTCDGVGYQQRQGEEWVPGLQPAGQPAPLEPLVPVSSSATIDLSTPLP